MPLVAGVDSSTQSCKVVIVDLETGALVRHGRAPHPQRTEVHPDIWWSALSQAIEAAGGIEDMSGIAVAAQQHGMICLDEAGEVVRPAMPVGEVRIPADSRHVEKAAGIRDAHRFGDSRTSPTHGVPVQALGANGNLRDLFDARFRRGRPYREPHGNVSWDFPRSAVRGGQVRRGRRPSRRPCRSQSAVPHVVLQPRLLREPLRPDK